MPKRLKEPKKDNSTNLRTNLKTQSDLERKLRDLKHLILAQYIKRRVSLYTEVKTLKHYQFSS